MSCGEENGLGPVRCSGPWREAMSVFNTTVPIAEYLIPGEIRTFSCSVTICHWSSVMYLGFILFRVLSSSVYIYTEAFSSIDRL